MFLCAANTGIANGNYNGNFNFGLQSGNLNGNGTQFLPILPHSA